MSARIRVALVGLGRMGRNWLRTLEASPRFDVVAVVDPVEISASTERSVRDLNFPIIDAAIVATPTPTHADVASELLDHGIPLLVEKPLAGTYAECIRLDSQARSAGVPLAVGHVERFNPAVRALFSAVRDGRVGVVMHACATRGGTRPAVVAPGNNVAVDLAVHDLDLLRMLLGPLRIKASHARSTMADCVDLVDVLLQAVDGTSAAVHANWTFATSMPPMRIRSLRVIGSHGVAMADCAEQTLTIWGPRGGNVDVVRSDALASQADAFAQLIDTGYGGNLCSSEDACGAVLLAERVLGDSIGDDWS